MHSFPPHVQDVDVEALNSQGFFYRLWREGNAADGAGRSVCVEGEGQHAFCLCCHLRVMT